MKFKEPELEDQFKKAPLFLQRMAFDFDEESKRAFGIEGVVTRITARIEGSSGVHEDGRAIDFRNEHGGMNLYTPDQRDYMVNYMNALYPRNDEKPTCYHHSFNNGPAHFHIQLAVFTKAYMPK